MLEPIIPTQPLAHWCSWLTRCPLKAEITGSSPVCATKSHQHASGVMTFMERALGFRAEADRVNWAVVEGSRNAPILVARDTAAAPVNLEEGPALSWYSSRVKLLVEAYKPAVATIRTAESVARGSNKDGARRRSRIEGVLLQTIDACGLKVTIGALAMISGRFGSGGQTTPKQNLDQSCGVIWLSGEQA